MGKRPNLLKKSKGEALFKKTAQIRRFEHDVWDQIEKVVIDYFLAVARQAGERARAQERTVMDATDVFPLESVGAQQATPESLFHSLQGLPTEDVVKFTRMLENWVRQQKARKS